eukprot:TRINITY_DN3817_c0_g2_i2.p1 TRINITY_DN3817_c0_g2~~TRINITY_DN3817_c0_g2_i2.p1  ORF type:complete len:415 (+),score=98.59 TRINITY_DN3817_c0_g2_i2:523-1767(+)
MCFPSTFKKELYSSCAKDSFKFNMESFGRKISRERQHEVFTLFKFLSFEGDIFMKDATNQFWIFEDVGQHQSLDVQPKQIYFCREISSSARDLIMKYTLKKRLYLGTTSFDAELSLVSANHARVGPGKIVFDPFVGTGSFLVSCAHFGAYTLGGDIDIRVLRGKEPGKDVSANMAQYGLLQNLIDIIRFDSSQNDLFVSRPLFDAIVTDPPYGVRAGAKKVAFKKGELTIMVDNLPPGWHSHISQTVPYSVPDVLTDLLQFAARTLVLGGHLVYWLPTTNEYQDSDVPDHPCFVLLSNSEQPLSTKFRRRMITLRKIKQFHSQLHGNWVASYDYEVAHANLAAKVMNDETRCDSQRVERAKERKKKLEEKLKNQHVSAVEGTAVAITCEQECGKKRDQMDNQASLANKKKTKIL